MTANQIPEAVELLRAFQSQFGARRPDEDEDDAETWDRIDAVCKALTAAQQQGDVEAVTFDTDFMRHIANLCRAAYDLCQPKPQRTLEDVREHYGELCLLELTSIADEIERRLAASSGKAGEAAGWVRGDTFVDAKFWTADTPPQGWTPVYLTAPPSTPVGVEGLIEEWESNLAEDKRDGVAEVAIRVQEIHLDQLRALAQQQDGGESWNRERIEAVASRVERAGDKEAADLIRDLLEAGIEAEQDRIDTAPQPAAVAAIQFALSNPEGMEFLRLWNEGEFETLRREWPEAPSSIYIGADPLATQQQETTA